MNDSGETTLNRPVWLVIAGLFGWIVFCFVAAWIGSEATRPQIPTWYAEIEKPSFNPPNWIFGPVWSLLFLMMAVAAWLVWWKSGWSRGWAALSLFGVQLVLNTAWSIIFFGLENPSAAAIEIVFLWISIGATLFAFWQHHKVAALLLLPYWAWVSFASVLNFSIAAMN